MYDVYQGYFISIVSKKTYYSSVSSQSVDHRRYVKGLVQSVQQQYSTRTVSPSGEEAGEGDRWAGRIINRSPRAGRVTTICIYPPTHSRGALALWADISECVKSLSTSYNAHAVANERSAQVEDLRPC